LNAKVAKEAKWEGKGSEISNLKFQMGEEKGSFEREGLEGLAVGGEGEGI